MSLGRHLRAIGALPGVVTVVVPALLVWLTEDVRFGWWSPAGAVLIAAGLALWAWTVWLFDRIGKGTLAPWDPTERLVDQGPFSHLRNPMITGVFAILFGEALLLGSWPIAEWGVVFVAINAIYIPVFEEPRLVERFGEQYEAYRRRVPRWLPRLRRRRSEA